MGTIVVGVDGSPGSDAALRWALAEAHLRAVKLRIVHAFQLPQLPLAIAGLGGVGAPGLAVPAAEDADRLHGAVEAQAGQLIEAALRRADGETLDGLEVGHRSIEGPAAQTLIESARDADLLVVGSRGRGGFLGLVLGSVSYQCAQHPPCPAVILPPPEDETTTPSQ